jgi:hypothetical protein
MTIEDIDRMVRDANPVHDLMALEPVDLSGLHITQQRSGSMQTNERIEVDREPNRPNRGLLIGMAAVALLLIGALAIFLSNNRASVAGQTPVVTEAPESSPDPTAAVATASGFLEAYASFDLDQAGTFLTDNAHLDLFGSEWIVGTAMMQAIGFQVLVGTCEPTGTTTTGIQVRCPYDYQAIHSDQIGLGPYGDNFFDITVGPEGITSASMSLEFTENGFSGQVWEPFAAWVSTTYPDDAVVMYIDEGLTDFAYTDASIALWEQHSQEYVSVVNGSAAVATASGFLEAYTSFDLDQAGTFLTDNAHLDLFGPDWNVGTAMMQAIGFQVLVGTCEPAGTAGTRVRCPYDYQAIHSDQIGLGPYGGNFFDITVGPEGITSASMSLEFAENGFSEQVWEPFAAWVSTIYPDDAAVMYSGSDLTDFAYTDASIALWEQHSQEYADLGLG